MKPPVFPSRLHIWNARFNWRFNPTPLSMSPLRALGSLGHIAKMLTSNWELIPSSFAGEFQTVRALDLSGPLARDLGLFGVIRPTSNRRTNFFHDRFRPSAFQ